MMTRLGTRGRFCEEGDDRPRRRKRRKNGPGDRVSCRDHAAHSLLQLAVEKGRPVDYPAGVSREERWYGKRKVEICEERTEPKRR